MGFERDLFASRHRQRHHAARGHSHATAACCARANGAALVITNSRVPQILYRVGQRSVQAATSIKALRPGQDLSRPPGAG